MSENDIDKYESIKELRKNVKAKKGSMGEEIESFASSGEAPPVKSKISPEERKLIQKTLEDISKGYSGAEKEGFTHTNKAKSFKDDGDIDE